MQRLKSSKRSILDSIAWKSWSIGNNPVPTVAMTAVRDLILELLGLN
jgi:hypothetical protein